jgi:hypothetical protein
MAAQGTAISLRAVSDDAASAIAIFRVKARWITRYAHSLTDRSILSSIVGNDGGNVGVPFSPYRVNGLKITDRAANNRVCGFASTQRTAIFLSGAVTSEHLL